MAEGPRFATIRPTQTDGHPVRRSDPTHRRNPMTTDQVLTNPNQQLWEQGDFTRIAASMGTSGEELVDRIGVTPNSRVLDLGCGDGPTAVPAARLGADVLGVDIARNLVAAGNRRAAA